MFINCHVFYYQYSICCVIMHKFHEFSAAFFLDPRISLRSTAPGSLCFLDVYLFLYDPQILLFDPCLIFLNQPAIYCLGFRFNGSDPNTGEANGSLCRVHEKENWTNCNLQCGVRVFG